jgi:hypothetical protein
MVQQVRATGLLARPVMLRPDYRYSGGAVSTSAVMDPGGYVGAMTFQPVRGSRFPFESGTTAGIASTR